MEGKEEDNDTRTRNAKIGLLGTLPSLRNDRWGWERSVENTVWTLGGVMRRKRKWVVTLDNHTDSRDNDYVAVWARNPSEARNLVRYHDGRETPGRIIPVAQFREEEGFVPNVQTH